MAGNNFQNSKGPSEGIEGFKRSDFVDPEKVLGTDVQIDQLPDGVKFYIRGQPIQLGGKQIVANLYELKREPDGLKLRKEHLEKFINRIPEDEEISLRYGPSDEGYIWIAKWRDLAGQEMGIMSETIRVSEKWRIRYEAEQKRMAAALAPVPVSPAMAPAQSQGFGLAELLRMQQDGEDRAYRNLERMATLLNQGKSETPSAVMEKAMESAGRIMEKSLEANFQMGKKVNEMIKETMVLPSPDDEEGEDGEQVNGEGDGAMGQDAILEGMPAWIKPFIGPLEKWIGTLLGGGPVANAVKEVIISSDEWKSVFANEQKMAEATKAMRDHFGAEKADKALAMLLAADKPKGKVKGK